MVASGPHVGIVDPVEKAFAFLQHLEKCSPEIWSGGCLPGSFSMELADTNSRMQQVVASMFRALADDFAKKLHTNTHPIGRKRNSEIIMKRILIIEDELEMLRNLTTILRLEKFRPLSAENGRVGVDLAKKQKPDLILCDVMMRGLDGYGVIAALRADAETVTIPFIFLTAKAEKLDIRAGMNLGADDYITKPVAKADLLAAIHSRLERANPASSAAVQT
jgi:CheY-like chemotaxis protein